MDFFFHWYEEGLFPFIDPPLIQPLSHDATSYYFPLEKKKKRKKMLLT